MYLKKSFIKIFIKLAYKFILINILFKFAMHFSFHTFHKFLYLYYVFIQERAHDSSSSSLKISLQQFLPQKPSNYLTLTSREFMKNEGSKQLLLWLTEMSPIFNIRHNSQSASVKAGLKPNTLRLHSLCFLPLRQIYIFNSY